VIRNDILECFILGYALEIPNNGRGRPVSWGQLCLAAKEKCGDFDSEELLDALYNLGQTNADLYKFLPTDSELYPFQPVSFEVERAKANWADFFMVGSFNIKVEPAGRLRFQQLWEQLQSELPREETYTTRIDGFAGK